MKTRESTHPGSSRTNGQPPMQHTPRRDPAHASRTASRTALERLEASGDAGALEYASWLRLLRRPAL